MNLGSKVGQKPRPYFLQREKDMMMRSYILKFISGAIIPGVISLITAIELIELHALSFSRT